MENVPTSQPVWNIARFARAARLIGEWNERARQPSVVGAGKAILLSGDCLFAEGRVSMLAIPDCRLDRYAHTVGELAGNHFDALLPGHGPAVLEDAAADIDRAAQSFRRLIPPPNFPNLGFA
jgi:hypothetical protein